MFNLGKHGGEKASNPSAAAEPPIPGQARLRLAAVHLKCDDKSIDKSATHHSRLPCTAEVAQALAQSRSHYRYCYYGRGVIVVNPAMRADDYAVVASDASKHSHSHD